MDRERLVQIANLKKFNHLMVRILDNKRNLFYILLCDEAHI